MSLMSKHMDYEAIIIDTGNNKEGQNIMKYSLLIQIFLE
jgi:hypothetical protein